MGGKGSGISRKRRTLPQRYNEGALSRADRRAAGVRQVLDGARQILADRGGDEDAGFLLRRLAHRTMHLDQLLAADELRLATGQPVDRKEYVAGLLTWLRYAQAIGLQRRARTVPPVDVYLRNKAAEKALAQQEGPATLE